MISEFHQLTEKISELAELAKSLRRENADLRLTIATISAENADMSKRIEQAYQRVSALLDKIPEHAEQNKEVA